ncbi:MAG: NADH-quinone oxidoreductase subunit L [Planctomycetota bacterium]
MTGLEPLQYIPWIAALGAVLCGLLCIRPNLKGWAGWVCVLAIAAGFGLTVNAVLPWATGKTHFNHVGDNHIVQAEVVTASPWIQVGGENVPGENGEIIGYKGGLQVDFGYYFDGLTLTMLLVVCGIGMLIAIYAVGYMRGDPGVARFFAAMALFIFAMTSLVMADNLVLLFLGWEGVGLCSYLLIGYYYGKTTAVDAAKKAFIVNRIGDLGFLVGIFLCYRVFGTLQFADIIPAVQNALDMVATQDLSRGSLDAANKLQSVLNPGNGTSPWLFYAIPFCLMVGAFGKSAQIPLFVWLPDAMAGPTPVSALVHAATMVTAGVYLIARCMPIFVLTHNDALRDGFLSPLYVVAAVGGVTALFAATIALTNNDLKGVFAYSTVSQLGYMFLGLGAISSTAAVFHLVTHAFFKALLFLTAGSVMHALAGTLDIRKMGGMGKHMPLTKWLMLAGCVALAGAPLTAGFFSKDEILAAAMIKGTGAHWGTGEGVFYFILAILGLVTAFLTAFYTFRLWCIVFRGETRYEMGDEHHSEDDSHDDHHAHEPHEMPFWPMNAPLVVLLVGALAVGFLLAPPKKLVGDDLPQVMHSVMHESSAYIPEKYIKTPADFEADDVETNIDTITTGYIVDVSDSHHETHADPHADDAHHGDHHAHPKVLGYDAHGFMMVISSIIALLGIAMAWVFYSGSRSIPTQLAAGFGALTQTLRDKYYIDELYDKAVVQPLNIVSQILFLVDQLVIHATVMGVGLLPGQVGKHQRKTQQGKLQGYGLGMLAGVAAIALLLLYLLNR